MRTNTNSAVRWLRTAFAAVALLGFAVASSAAEPAQAVMNVPLYKSRVVTVVAPVARVAVGNPDVADIVIIHPTEIYVLGKDLGATNVLLWGKDNLLVKSIDIEVVHDLEGLKERYHRLMPNEQIEVYASQRSIVLAGRVSDVEKMTTAVKLAEGYLAQVQTAKKAEQFEQQSQSRREDKTVGSVINLLRVAGSQQVMVEVKVAEIQRSELKRLDAQFNTILGHGQWRIGGVNGGATFPQTVFASGVGLDAAGQLTYVPGAPGGLIAALPGKAPFGPNISEFKPNTMQIQDQGLFAGFVSGSALFNLALDAAKENGAAKILAEPTLTTLTGQEAHFLSGGEFPIPVLQGVSGVGIVYKEFGVGLDFTPVVLNDGHINLKMNVAVSEVVSNNSIGVTQAGVTSSFIVPSIAKRSASTTVELGDGQTIAIAGLINENVRELVTKFPGLGSIPVLGALFRSQDYQRGQTELLILVTPKLAKPLPTGPVALPTDGFVDPSDVDFYLMGRTEGTASRASGTAKNP